MANTPTQTARIEGPGHTPGSAAPEEAISSPKPASDALVNESAPAVASLEAQALESSARGEEPRSTAALVGALVGCLFAVAYGLQHPITQALPIPSWAFLALILAGSALLIASALGRALQVWLGPLLVAFGSLGLALYYQGAELERLAEQENQAASFIGYWLQGAASRGILLVGVSAAAVLALAGEWVLFCKEKLLRAPSAPHAASPQAYMALLTWGLALLFGRHQLELGWFLEDFAIFGALIGLGLLLAASASLKLGLWVPLVFVVASWVRAEIAPALNHPDGGVLASSLFGGLEAAQRERLVVLDSSASFAAMLLLLWSQRARLVGSLRWLLLAPLTLALLFGAERFIDHAEKEYSAALPLLSDRRLNIPEQALAHPAWHPKAPIWGIGASQERWYAPPNYQQAPFEPALLSAQLESPRRGKNPGGKISAEEVAERLVPEVLLLAQGSVAFEQIEARVSPLAGRAFGILLRDSRVRRGDELAQAASVHALRLSYFEQAELPAAGGALVQRYAYDLESQALAPLAGPGAKAQVLFRGEALANYVSAEKMSEPLKELWVYVPKEWLVGRFIGALAPVLALAGPDGARLQLRLLKGPELLTPWLKAPQGEAAEPAVDSGGH